MTPPKHRDQEPHAVRQPGVLRVILLCLLPVALLFLVYEIVERTWLTGVDPEVLHILHIVRGLSAATIAAVVATILLLGQEGDLPVGSDRSAAAHSWKRNVQRVSLRTKIIVPVVGLAVVPVMLTGMFTISRTRDSLRERVVQRIEFDTVTKAQSIQQFFETIGQDLRFLSQLRAIRDLAGVEDVGSSEPFSTLREEAQRELLVFSQGKRAYYQVRYLNRAGHEVVRLNMEDGRPQSVPVPQLQDKSSRGYVQATLALDAGDIHVSPMDLNVEHGKVEVPHRGVMRYAMRVTDDDGQAQGLVVINVFADFLSDLVGPFAPQTEAWLVAQDGTYLEYFGGGQEVQDMFSLEKKRHLSSDYRDEEVAVILGEGDERRTLWTASSLVSAAPILLPRGGPDRQWYLLVAHSRGPVEVPIRYLTVFLLVVTILVATVAGVIGFLVAHYVARPMASLRRATREIASGNLSKRLEITTGDEIEALAIDFNTMTDQLQEAQQRLATWNAKLEQEVARKTDHLHQLQSGLARADKMASIGQLAAGVMHEIGNPLAAIKTRIQVSEEEDELSEASRQLMTEVLSEVDRLAAFLRPFSRLTRLREINIEEVSVAEVARGVIVLVSPELKRRGISLCMDLPSDLPTIGGDADQLRQLLINLILNASDASPNGGEIHVRAQHVAPGEDHEFPTDSVIIRVIDQGIGMSQDVIDKIGTPFYSTKPDGTGLGLAICRQIVRDHEGSMRIRSAPGEGTSIALIFNRWEGGQTRPESARASVHGPKPSSERES